MSSSYGKSIVQYSHARLRTLNEEIQCYLIDLKEFHSTTICFEILFLLTGTSYHIMSCSCEKSIVQYSHSRMRTLYEIAINGIGNKN